MKKILMCFVCFMFMVSIAFAEGFTTNLGTTSQLGSSYYGFLINPYKVQQFLVGDVSYDFDTYGKVGFQGNIGLGYDNQYVANNNNFSEFAKLYYQKTWENFLLTEIGWMTNQRLMQQEYFTQEFYGKAALNIDWLNIHPFVSYNREFQQFGINKISLGTEQTLPLSDVLIGRHVFGLYTFAGFNYVKLDNGSSLGKFDGFHSYELALGLPIYTPHGFDLTPMISYTGALSPEATSNMKSNSFNHKTGEVWQTSLNLTYKF